MAAAASSRSLVAHGGGGASHAGDSHSVASSSRMSHASLISVSSLPGAPSHHRHEFSPDVLFKKRFQLFDAIHEDTRLIFGTDVSRSEPTRIMLLIYTSEDEWNVHVEVYRLLRSKWVANLLDKFFDEDTGRWYIVVERGGLTLEEYLSTKDQLSMDERKAILGQVAACWIHLYNLNCYMEMKTWSFMQYGKDWRLFDMTFVYKGNRSDPHNALFCAKPLADAVMEGSHSILLPDQELEFEHTLGSTLLEFLLLNPIFEGKTIEDVYDLVALDDLVERVHALPEATKTDEDILFLTKKILTSPDKWVEKADDLVVAADTLVTFLGQTKSGRSAGSPTAHQSYKFLTSTI